MEVTIAEYAALRGIKRTRVKWMVQSCNDPFLSKRGHLVVFDPAKMDEFIANRPPPGRKQNPPPPRVGWLSKPVHTGRDASGKMLDEWTCSCGNKITLPRYMVIKRHHLSCGCIGKVEKEGPGYNQKTCRTVNDLFFNGRRPKYTDPYERMLKK